MDSLSADRQVNGHIIGLWQTQSTFFSLFSLGAFLFFGMVNHFNKYQPGSEKTFMYRSFPPFEPLFLRPSLMSTVYEINIAVCHDCENFKAFKVPPLVKCALPFVSSCGWLTFSVERESRSESEWDLFDKLGNTQLESLFFTFFELTMCLSCEFYWRGFYAFTTGLKVKVEWENQRSSPLEFSL